MIYVSLPYKITIFNCIIDIYIYIYNKTCTFIVCFDRVTDWPRGHAYIWNLCDRWEKGTDWNRIQTVSDLSSPLLSPYSYLHETYEILILFSIFIVSLIKARLYRCKFNFVANGRLRKIMNTSHTHLFSK